MRKTHKHDKTIINGVEFACPKCGGHILRAVSTGFACYESIWECHVKPEGVVLDKLGEPERGEGTTNSKCGMSAKSVSKRFRMILSPRCSARPRRSRLR